jgi:predicted Rossmann-fold nucleotide-binding protein
MSLRSLQRSLNLFTTLINGTSDLLSWQQSLYSRLLSPKAFRVLVWGSARQIPKYDAEIEAITDGLFKKYLELRKEMPDLIVDVISGGNLPHTIMGKIPGLWSDRIEQYNNAHPDAPLYGSSFAITLDLLKNLEQVPSNKFGVVNSFMSFFTRVMTFWMISHFCLILPGGRGTLFEASLFGQMSQFLARSVGKVGDPDTGFPLSPEHRRPDLLTKYHIFPRVFFFSKFWQPIHDLYQIQLAEHMVSEEETIDPLVSPPILETAEQVVAEFERAVRDWKLHRQKNDFYGNLSWWELIILRLFTKRVNLRKRFTKSLSDACQK